MLWTTACALLLLAWLVVYALDMYARSRELALYLRFVEYTGLCVQPLQVNELRMEINICNDVDTLVHCWLANVPLSMGIVG
jgi:hypothetical protein